MRILIATVSAGAGHIQAANALHSAWKRLRPRDTVTQTDVLETTPWLYKAAYVRGYIQLIETAPELYALAFRKTDNPTLVTRMTRFRRAFSRTIARAFVRQVRAFRPDIVLCPHFLPLEILGGMPRMRKKPFVAAVVTDFNAHALWVDGATDLLCVATDETAARLHARGVAPERIVVTGIPLRPMFVHPPTRHAARKQFGLRDDLPVVLLLGGGLGMGPIEEALRAVDALATPLQLVVVTGKNEKLRSALNQVTWKHPTRILGFIDDMAAALRAASLVITKPGGLTVSEALATGTPLLIIDPIPGQEAENSDFLLERGVASKANRIEDLPYRVERLLSTDRLRSMAKAARSLGVPDAAERVVRAVLLRNGIRNS